MPLGSGGSPSLQICGGLSLQVFKTLQGSIICRICPVCFSVMLKVVKLQPQPCYCHWSYAPVAVLAFPAFWPWPVFLPLGEPSPAEQSSEL